MLGRGVLSRLHCLTQQESYTLTLYLDIDQNKQSNRNRGYVVQADALLKDLKAQFDDDGRLRDAMGEAMQEVESIATNGKAALVVVHPETALKEVHQIRVGFPASAHWRRGAFLRPVVEAMDEHECYGVVLTDSQRARIFTVYMGEINEHEDLSSDTSPRVRALGADQWRSQKRHDRHHEEGVALHAKRVIDALHDLALRKPYDRLIVAGPTKAASQVVRLLPKRLRGKLVESISLPVTASEKKVLAGILEVQRGMERKQEKELVAGLLAELHDGGKAVAGLTPVIDAVNQGRVWKLVYESGFKADGGECRECGAFSDKPKGFCPTCRSRLQTANGFVDRLCQGVLDAGGQVEIVSGEAGATLEEHGSISALLRY